MRILTYLAITVLLCASCERTGLKKYYTRISPEEFASYDSLTLSVKSKYGTVYHAYKRSERGSMDDFLLFEKRNNGAKGDLFKMNGDIEIKNDSTFIIYGATLLVSGDTVNWVKGLWFYSYRKGGTTFYKVDSLPHSLPKIDYQGIQMGIYKYAVGKLTQVSSSQSEDAFTGLNTDGFFYLPNPGRFYLLAGFNQIE